MVAMYIPELALVHLQHIRMHPSQQPPIPCVHFWQVLLQQQPDQPATRHLRGSVLVAWIVSRIGSGVTSLSISRALNIYALTHTRAQHATQHKQRTRAGAWTWLGYLLVQIL